jgi:hypothetical protein
VSRYSAPAILLLVTPLLLAYGRFSWSWLAGPVAAVAVWAIERKAHEPAEPAAGRDPIPVD